MKKPIKTFVLQQDQSDCGVACLASIIKFHGGASNLEQLRRSSGTSRQGTTLLGLMEAARQLNFEAEGMEAEGVHNLHELEEPAILHVLMENKLQHYIVYYPEQLDRLKPSGLYKLGDPAKGIIEMDAVDLEDIWKSKALLKLIPTEKFERKTIIQAKKKDWIIFLIRDDFHLLLVSLFLGITISVLGISTAIFSQKLIDDILPNGNSKKLLLSLILVTLLLFVRSGLAYLRGLFMITQSKDFNNRIIQRFYGNLLQLPKSFFDTRKIGELIARMNDTRRIQSVLSAIAGSVIIDLLLVLVSLGFMFGFSYVIGFIILACLPIYSVILFRFNRPIIKTHKEVMARYAMSESNFVDTMQGVADIKLMNKQSFFEKINASLYNSFQEKIADLGKLSIRFNWASELAGIVFSIAVFSTASWLVLKKELKIGEMVALLSMTGNVIPAVNRLIISNVQLQEALVAFDRMFEFTSLEKETKGEYPSPNEHVLFDDVLEVSNISFRFPGRKQILNNISLRVQKGNIIALLGESGGGKSTLLQLVQKFYRPESGYILVGGNDLQTIKTSSWRDQLGSVPQDIKIFNGSLLYNITLSNKSEDFQKAYEFCERKGLSAYFNEFPQGYLTLLGEEGINISGGQKQIVALARALFREPKLLLLDEATSAMDRNTESFVLSLLQKEKEKMAILIVTHRIITAKSCDGIYILENGSISTSGTPVQLLRTENLYSRYYTELIS